jgi:hypothetical protein
MYCSGATVGSIFSKKGDAGVAMLVMMGPRQLVRVGRERRLIASSLFLTALGRQATDPMIPELGD